MEWRTLFSFQTFLENRQKSYNTISTYICALRAIYNRAIDRGVTSVSGEYRMFANLKTGVSSERKLNFNLSHLSEYCGMRQMKLSSYTARHTWATLAKYCQVPEEVISEGLGHSSLQITRTYLKSFQNGELAHANKLVNDYILTGKKTAWSR